MSVKLAALLAASIFTISASAMVRADTLWRLVNSSEYQNTLAALSLPDGAVSPRAILIDGEDLDRMVAGAIFELEISESISHQYRMGEGRRFANGDRGWVGTIDDSFNRYSLSLTKSGELVLGSFFSPSGKYKIQLTRLPDQLDVDTDASSHHYVGWLFGNPQNFEPVPYEGRDDSGAAFARFGSVSARGQVSSNNVTIRQTIPESNVVIGEEFELMVEISNDSNYEIVDKVLTVGALLYTATYVDGPEFCGAEPVHYSSGPELELFCYLDSLGPGESETMTFGIVVNESSYPALPSIVVVDEIFDTEFLFVSHNTLMDSDSDGISDFNEKILSTDPNDSASSVSVSETVEIDVLFLYTRKFADDVEHGRPETEINQFVQETNSMFAASGAALSYNPVYYGLTSYQVNNDVGASWDDLRTGAGQSFNDVSFLRVSQGADLVVLVDGDYVDDVEGSCGIANLAGLDSQGDLSHPWWQESSIYSVIYRPDSYNPDSNFGCDETVLAHELGHLMGLVHSRIDESDEGTFPWARGHGEDGVFHTIMAYSAHFPNSTGVPLFSNPQISDCFGRVCGVSQDDIEQGANAVLALNTTRFAVANYMQTRPSMSVSSLSGDTTGATILGGAAVTDEDSDPDFLFKTVFNPFEGFSLVGSINVADEHVGEIGMTHIVILVDGVSYYQLDASGNYLQWNGDVAQLHGNTEPRPLQSREELVAFKDFVAAQEGFTEADLTVYFAYGLLDSEVFVYSDQGTSIRVQPSL